MLLVGLTGGIGSGKSTAARMLEVRGAVVFDADVFAREAIAPGTTGYAQVIEAFGPSAVTGTGEIDRPRLAARVFGDPDARQRLEAIVHPEVARRLAEAVEPYRDTDKVVVYAVPLLAERGLADLFDVVVVLSVDEELRVARLMSERAIGEEGARERIAAQASEEDRARVANAIIDNDGTREELEAQVDRLWRDLEARAMASHED